MLYTISVCGNVSVPQCGASSAVCAHDLKTNSFRSVGKYACLYVMPVHAPFLQK